MAAKGLFFNTGDTIVAPATPIGRSALAILRISGPEAFRILRDAIGSQAFPQIRESSYRHLYSVDGQVLDECVVVCYEGPHSFTGEDLVEITSHGNPLVIRSILKDFVSRGTRTAEAGEFTRRAIANSKLSLSEAESLYWVLFGTRKDSIQMGLKAKLGALGKQVETFRNKLLVLHADFEANLDFNEFESLDPLEQGFDRRLQALIDELRSWIKVFEYHQARLGSKSVCLLGPPNSGKSSLFNALLGMDRSIVFDQPGTTRDLVEALETMEGIDLRLVDTAGIRNSEDPIELLGIRRSLEAVKSAEIVCWISDKAEMPVESLLSSNPRAEWVFISSKADLEDSKRLENSILVSSKSGQGIGELKHRILLDKEGIEPESYYLTSDRQREHCQRATRLLQEAYQTLQSKDYFEVAAEKVREATQELVELIGEMPTNEVVASILSRFCIGK